MSKLRTNRKMKRDTQGCHYWLTYGALGVRYNHDIMKYLGSLIIASLANYAW